MSSDEIRREFGDVNDQSQNARVFEEVEKRLKQNILEGKNVIFDATNISYKKRRAWLERFNRYDIQKIAVLVATPYEECLERNSKRERKVPEEVITRMYHNFYIPQYYEGFDEILIKYNSEYEFNWLAIELDDIPQDNPHHTLSVVGHCLAVARCLKKEKYDLWVAGLLHDIGKIKTKTFVNMKGETTDVAHFYNHEKVSAYDALFYEDIRSLVNMFNDKATTVLNILKLIQWHMIMHFEMSDKTIAKYKNMLGENTWKDLEILHKADCEAR